MNRTFSLQRLFLNITVLAIVLAIITRFPEQSLRFAVFASAFVPAIVLSDIAAWNSRRPKVTLACGLLGVALAPLLGPAVNVNWDGPPSWWDVAMVEYPIDVVGSIVCAALGVGLALSTQLSRNRR